ncbi:divergent PAP2 family protein [Desemzia incerta]|uniref:divergent PAP2 family protein n=1 Tax=Desemzia incerta TaxID=82801 RepID=UPI0024C30466|nr:divergent PAP2 family protein [Desemzia incerta]WHZ31176.1 divergent PAP2 family protein [Desemzia incerta]
MFSNYPLMAAFSAIVFAQFIKVPVAYVLNRKTTIALVTSTGGMPSSHSAAVSSLITALALEYGIESPLVAIASTFGVIVMFDSMGVRRQSGEQGILLNELIIEFTRLREKVWTLSQDPTTKNFKQEQKERHLKEYLGHKPIEVFFGILTGIAVAYVTKMILGQ